MTVIPSLISQADYQLIRYAQRKPCPVKSRGNRRKAGQANPKEKMTEPEPKIEVTKKVKSTKRKKDKIIPVRVTPEEHKKIEDLAGKCSLAPSTYLRTVGLEKTIKSTLDSQVIIELAKLRSETGRLGGLIKAWLSPKEKIIGSSPEGKTYLANNKPALKDLLRELDGIISEIEDKVKGI